MIYKNPVISGFFPDPSVCKANGSYYLVCSSFHYFPGIPLFESKDLINWNMIGNVLTRESQLPLAGASSYSGIFAPTIRYNNGRFYVVTTNTTTGGNFYVYTDDIYGEWSDPIYVKQDGIDPSLYFEDSKAYFMSNGSDDCGGGGIVQCEIDIATGEKLSPCKCVWKGAGGRFLESPHLYKINGLYYLMASEGGTEYGHMVVYARGESVYGPFENYCGNPVLTNRNLGGYQIQGCGHADLIEDHNGNWWMLHLGFRQISPWIMHHITGREVYLVPVKFDENGWFTAGENGTVRESFETDLINAEQEFRKEYTFKNTRIGREWCFLRNPDMENYIFSENSFILKASETSLSDCDGSPSFVAIRQKEMNMEVSCDISVADCEAGLTFYMTESQHYEIAVRKTSEGYELFRRLCIGDIQHEDNMTLISSDNAKTVKLIVNADNYNYLFRALCDGKEYALGSAQTKYLSSEIAGNFTGVMIGLYAHKNNTGNSGSAEFTNFVCTNKEDSVNL